MLSSVFKNMVGIAQSGAQRGPLELTDEYVEHSQVVEATLDILYNSEITSFTDDNLYHHVIEFARKYDMSTIPKPYRCRFGLTRLSPTRRTASDYYGSPLISVNAI